MEHQDLVMEPHLVLLAMVLLQQLQVMELQLLDMGAQLQATEPHLDRMHMQLLDMGDLKCSSHHMGLHPKT